MNEAPAIAKPQGTHAPARPKRRWRGISLRALMLLVLILGGGLGWIAHRARVQREAVATIERAGGGVGYGMPWSRTGPWLPPKKSRAPMWLQKALGPHYFETATTVQFISQPGSKPWKGVDGALRAASDLPWVDNLMVIKADVTDAGTERLGEITNLKSLDLRMNPALTARSVKGLDQLTDLRELKLASIPLRDADMGFLRSMSKLESLMLPGRTTTLGDDWLTNLEGRTTLRFLQLYDIPITSKGLEHLRGLTNLGVLTLHGAKVDDLDAIRGMSKLGVLGLYGNPIDDDDLAVLKALPSLYSLDLRKTKITDEGMAHLRDLPNLRELDLGDTAITDAGLKTLAGSKSLRSFSIRGSRITPEGYAAFQARRP